MKKTTTNKPKLSLASHTLRDLQPDQLAQVAGARRSDSKGCEGCTVTLG